MSLNTSEMFGICTKTCCITLKANKSSLIEAPRCFSESVLNRGPLQTPLGGSLWEGPLLSSPLQPVHLSIPELVLS